MKVLFALYEDVFSIIGMNLMRPYLEQLGASFSVVVTKNTEKTPHILPALHYAEKKLPFEGLFPLADEMGAKSNFLTPQGFKREYGVDFISINSVNTPEIHDLIGQHDVTLSIRCKSIFKAEAISRSRLGVFNLHSAPLPAFRGLYATFHALRQGMNQIGCTIHRIDTGIDTGGVIGRASYAYEEGQSFFDCIRKVYFEGIPVLGQLLTDLAHGNPIADIPTLPEAEAYYTVPTPEQVQEFHSRNIPLVLPSDVQNLINDFIGDQKRHDNAENSNNPLFDLRSCG